MVRCRNLTVVYLLREVFSMTSLFGGSVGLVSVIVRLFVCLVLGRVRFV